MRSATLRPTALAGIAAGALALSLTACGSSAADAEKPAATAPIADGCSYEPEVTTEEGTRTVTDTFLGDVTDVPNDPQRIVALWRVGSELADLCVVPVGQLDAEFAEEEIDPNTWGNYEDVPVVGTWEGVDVEKLIELEPDLIIGMDHGGLSIDYDEIKEIAPTVILDIEEPTDVWANYPQVADLVGRANDFSRRDGELDAELARIKDEFGDVIGDLEVTSITSSDQLYVETSKSLSWERFDKAGFGYNPTYATDPDRYVEAIAMENIPDLADQDIIFFEATPEGDPVPEITDLLESASFKRLPAVKKGNVFPLADGTTYTFPRGHEQLDDLRHAAENYQP